MLSNKIIEMALAKGATRANIISADAISLDKRFRDICATNACGKYGKCYMCPPDVGESEELMKKIKEYDFALVYQTVSELEDSFDYEGMTEAKRAFYLLSQSIRQAFSDLNIEDALHLGVGGCGVCSKCAIEAGEPCRFPEKAMPSLEAYCVNVSELAKSAGMKYINGQNTVTYFGAVLFSAEEKL